MPRITPCLWFDTNGEEAAQFYASIFPNSKILTVTHYSDDGPQQAGSVLTVEFELDGQRFTALNGGPQFTFTEATSLQVLCDDQDEVDYYWERLSEGGEKGPCGWLKDRFGFSWQVFPTAVPRLLDKSDPERAARVLAAIMKMGKIEIAELERAAQPVGA